jgi:hypothetical protein
MAEPMTGTEFLEQLRKELPTLLREHPEVRHELWGIMLEAFPSRQEFTVLLEEIRASREEANHRFEAMDRRFEEMRQDMDRRFEEMRQDMDRRFEAVDRRFEAVIAELHLHGEELQRLGREMRQLNLHMSSLGGRVGHGLEGIIREAVEEFAGDTFAFAERLVLRDETGEVYGVPGAEVEFDLYAHNGRAAYLVEGKSYLKPTDVLIFHKKVKFAEGKLGRPIIPLVLALSLAPRAEQKLQELGIQYRVGVGMESE